jgi:hypothetical protein
MANIEEPVGHRSPVTLQTIVLIVFGLLAIAIVVVAVLGVATPFETRDPFTVPRTLAVLLIAAIACLAVAWLDGTNAALVGRGLRHLLSIHRAAVATFVVASTATIAISIFVALAALFSGEIKRGLYALAAIEFLLKLAAVSAIIVLITLRKPLVGRTLPTQKQVDPANADEARVVETEQEERGRLEFGSLAFAFSLVVIAGLIVPSEDLMRLASMFFGGDKKLEDYLPQRPLVTVEDGLSDRVVEAIEDVAWVSAYLSRLNSEQRLTHTDGLKSQVEVVLYDLEIENAKRLGAWPLLEAICYDRQDTMIFSNSDNKILADHLVYLSTEGLVEYPYGDVNSIKLTRYGSLVMSKYMFKNALPDCSASSVRTTTVASATPFPSPPAFAPRLREIDPSQVSESITEASLVRDVQIGSGTIYRLSLPAGRYRVELQSMGRADPFLQLFDADGRLIGEDDDSGQNGAFDAQLDLPVRDGDKYYLRTSSYDGRSGDARLLIGSADVIIDSNTDFTALRIARDTEATPLAATAVVPPGGAVFSFTAATGGEHSFNFAYGDADSADEDLVAILFEHDGADYIQVGKDDDSGLNGLPALVVTLTETSQYLLVLKHFEQAIAAQATVTVTVDPPLATTSDAQAAGAETAGGAPTEAPPAIADEAEPGASGSDDSQ